MKHTRLKNVAVLSALSLYGLAACSSGENNGAYVGYVEAEYVYVAAPQPGWLTEAPVKQGDEIAAGDMLFELDKDQQSAMLAAAAARATEAEARIRDIETGARPEEIEALEAQLAEARSGLTLARAERDRWLPLVREGNASKARGDKVNADYNAAVARVKAAEEAITVAKLGGRDAAQQAAVAAAASAKAAHEEAAWVLSQRTVKAQTGGRIEDVYHRKGEFVPAGAPVLSILPASALKVRFFVPQEDLPGVSLGAPVRIDADGVGAPVDATISYIAAEAEFTPPVIYSVGSREKLVFMAEARLDASSGLRPGLPVDVMLP